MTAPSCVDVPRKLAEAPKSPRSLSNEFLRYLGCSVLALAADFGCYSLVLALGLGYPLAAALGFVVGLSVAYATSVRFAFAARSLRDRHVEFAIFAGIGVFGLLLTEALLWLLVTRWHMEPHLAKLLTAGFVFVSNFSLRKLVLFRRAGTEAQA